MSPKNYPVMTLFGRTLKFLTDEFQQRLENERIPLSIVEFVLLYRLSTMEEDTISQQHFANMERKHKSVILRQVDGLEMKKLVTRSTDPEDARKNIVQLTKKGWDVLNKTLAIEDTMMKEMTKGLKASEIETLKKVSLTIQSNAMKK